MHISRQPMTSKWVALRSIGGIIYSTHWACWGTGWLKGKRDTFKHSTGAHITAQQGSTLQLIICGICRHAYNTGN